MKSISASKARRSPSRVNSPSASRDQNAWNVAVASRGRRTGSRGRRRRRTGRPRCRRTGRPATAAGATRGRVPGRSRRRPRGAGARRAAARRGGPRAGSGPARGRARARRRWCPRALGSIGSGRSPSASSVGDAALGQGAPLPRRDPGDEAQVVVRAPAGDAFGRPAADVAVLDRLGVGAGRRVGRRRLVGHRGQEPRLRARGSRPCSRRRAGARPRGRCRRARRASTRAGRPGSARAGRRTMQIWRTALAFTWRASFVSATS